jgi:WD40 repeat-containing protein SMU1
MQVQATAMSQRYVPDVLPLLCSPSPTAASGEVTVNSVTLNPVKADELLVCTKSNAVCSMTSTGTVTKTWSSGRQEESAYFVAMAVSPRGAFLYALGGDGNIYCFNVAQGRLEHLLKVHSEGTAIGLAHHPHRNLLASFADEDQLKLWRAGPA